MSAQDVPWGLAAVFFGTLLASIVITPLCRRLGFLDRPTARKRHGALVPYSGGLALGVALLPWGFGPGEAYLPWPAMAGLALLWLLGLIDDAKPLSSLLKFSAQAVAASALVAGLRLPIEVIGQTLLPSAIPLSFAYGLAIFCAVGLINALNMIDGIDGLAGSQVLAVLATLGVFASFSVPEASAVAGVTGAAVLAYLLFNFPHPFRPLRIFMGDSGALLLGGLLVAITVLQAGGGGTGAMDEAAPWALLYLLSDTMAVSFARISVGRSPFSPDRWHLHHQLLDAGLSPRQVIACSVGVTILGGGVGAVLKGVGVPTTGSFLALLVVISAYALVMAQRLRRRAGGGEPLASSQEAG